MGSQSVGHDWCVLAHMHTHELLFFFWIFFNCLKMWKWFLAHKLYKNRHCINSLSSASGGVEMICPRSHSWSLAGQPLNPELSGSKPTNCLASLKPPWSIFTRTPGRQERRNPDLLNHLRTKQIHGLNVLRTNFKTGSFSQCSFLIYLLKEFVCVCMCVCVCVCVYARTRAHSVMSNSLWPHGL